MNRNGKAMAMYSQKQRAEMTRQLDQEGRETRAFPPMARRATGRKRKRPWKGERARLWAINKVKLDALEKELSGR